MASLAPLFLCFTCITVFGCCHGDKIPSEPSDALVAQCIVDSQVDKRYRELEFDHDDCPGLEHKLKFRMEGAEKECFHQFLREGAKLEVTFKVLRGGNELVEVTVKQPDDVIVWKEKAKNGTLETTANSSGVYSICVDNVSKVTFKKIVLTISSVLPCLELNYNNIWDSHHGDEDQAESHLSAVKKHLASIWNNQLRTNGHLINDWITCTSINLYVLVWGAVIAVVTMGTSYVQLYFLQRIGGEAMEEAIGGVVAEYSGCDL